MPPLVPPSRPTQLIPLPKYFTFFRIFGASSVCMTRYVSSLTGIWVRGYFHGYTTKEIMSPFRNNLTAYSS